MQSGLASLPLRKVFTGPRTAQFKMSFSFSLFGQAEVIEFLLVKCVFHTVQVKCG